MTDRDDAVPAAPGTGGGLPLRTLDVRARPAAPQPPADDARATEDAADGASGGRTAAGWAAAGGAAVAGGAAAFAAGRPGHPPS